MRLTASRARSAGRIVSAVVSAVVGTGPMGSPATAEPVTDRILAGHQILMKDGCSFLKINFNIRIRYASHFPVERGAELRILLRPIDPGQAASEMLTRREALRPPSNPALRIKAIEFEAGRAEGPTLVIQFQQPVAFQVGPGADFESIVVAFPDPKSGKACRPVYPIGASSAWSTTIQGPEPGRQSDPSVSRATAEAPLPTRVRDRPTGKIADADLKAVAAAMDEARAAIKKGDLAKASRLLAKVLSYPDNPHSADAQELLGVAYQKNKQPGEAKAEYEDYLRRYPTGEGAESVRQRLAAIMTAEAPREEKLRIAKQANGTDGRGSGETTWSVSGSFSQFYVRDDSFRVLRDPTLPPILNADKEDHRVHRNAILSSADLFAVWGNDQMKSKFRFSGTEEHRFGVDDSEIVGVSALFYEAAIRDWGTMMRIGRQSRNAGGVLGRFDGGLVTVQATPWMKWNLVGGSPVASRRDEPFKDDKAFLGASIDFNTSIRGLDFSLFAIEQRAKDVVDRQAIGAEARYLDATTSAFATVDYDLHFQQLNAVIASASLTLPDKSTIHGGVDYRRSPYLSSWNALQGQQALTLFELLKMRSKSEIAQMALDRTATYKAITIGHTRALAENLQLNVDATASHIDGTITSYGVDSMPSTGDEYYLGAQLVASSVFRDGDLFSTGVRFADRRDSNVYTVDVSSRFPLSKEWRINPRVLVSYREGKTIDLAEITVLPSVLFNYYLGRDWTFELEVGAKRTFREQARIKEDETELFFTAGYRLDFNADGRRNCQTAYGAC